jgi:hypothetical protein
MRGRGTPPVVDLCPYTCTRRAAGEPNAGQGREIKRPGPPPLLFRLEALNELLELLMVFQRLSPRCTVLAWLTTLSLFASLVATGWDNQRGGGRQPPWDGGCGLREAPPLRGGVGTGGPGWCGRYRVQSGRETGRGFGVRRFLALRMCTRSRRARRDDRRAQLQCQSSVGARSGSFAVETSFGQPGP